MFYKCHSNSLLLELLSLRVFADGKICCITYIPLSHTGNKAASLKFLQELPRICTLDHTPSLYTKSIHLQTGIAAVVPSLPALLCWDLWTARIQQSLGEGEDGTGGKSDQQMTAGDASLGDGGLHGTDGRGEDVRLLEDLR